MEQSREWSNTLPNSVVAIEKGFLGSLSTAVANFNFYYKEELAINNLQLLLSHKKTPPD